MHYPYHNPSKSCSVIGQLTESMEIRSPEVRKQWELKTIEWNHESIWIYGSMIITNSLFPSFPPVLAVFFHKSLDRILAAMISHVCRFKYPEAQNPMIFPFNHHFPIVFLWFPWGYPRLHCLPSTKLLSKFDHFISVLRGPERCSASHWLSWKDHKTWLEDEEKPHLARWARDVEQ